MRWRALSLVIALFSLCAAIGADGEADAFKSAVAAFGDKFYERAEEQLGAFEKSFPNSTNVPQSILLRAQARHFQKNYDGAIELLSANMARAGALGDQYALTWGETLSAKGDHGGAAEQFGRILKEYPNSPLRLQAAYLQALSAFQQKDYNGTVALLSGESVFAKLASAAPQDRFSFAGNLLMADALLALGRVEEARNAATALPSIPEQAQWQWERFDALARVELAGTNHAAAISYLTNAAAVAEAAQRPRLQAQSLNLEAELYRKIGQTTNAVAVYDKMAAIEGLPIDQRRLAVLKVVELLSSTGETTNAIRRIETYLAAATNEPAADLLKMKAGELWIGRGREIGRAGKPEGEALVMFTNALAQARAHLNGVITQFTNSTHIGRAWLNLGWASWEEGMLLDGPARVQESEAAFRTASEKLSRSDDQAVAIYKMADAQVRLRQTKTAATNYARLLRDYADLPQVKNGLFDKAYAQLVRVNIELNDLEAAESHLKKLREEFPKSPATEEALFLFGQAVMMSKPEQARTVFQEFVGQFPASPLLAEVRFAEARTYGVEGDFGTAVQKHESWLQTFTNHPVRAEVEFERGVLLDKAGGRTNALSAFSEFIARHATSPLAPAAQMWVADYFISQEQLREAELNYQKVFQNTNWAGTPLAYLARMEAARTAFKRQGYSDARSYLTNLINDPKCPPELKPQAWYALGDMFVEEPITGSTNALHNFVQAAAVFDRVATQYPTNDIALLAIARKGDCHFQIASHPNYAESYTVASNAYWTVLKTDRKLPVKVRNQAEFGLARVLEKMADGKKDEERTGLRKAALNHYLNVVYGDGVEGQKSDPQYLKWAGREAGRLAEELGETDAAIELYKRLSTSAPAAKTLWESRITLLENGKKRRETL
jgi:TolA-binding protein